MGGLSYNCGAVDPAPGLGLDEEVYEGWDKGQAVATHDILPLDLAQLL